MFSFVVYIKSLACLLITNSHFNRIWPISAMATGGAIGNALFFMVAGFCLSRVDGNFRSWYGKRLFRLYPQTWMVSLITLLFNQEKPCDAIAYLRIFIFPTWYWFVGAIALYYAICFAIKKNRVNVKIVYCIWLIIYAAYYAYVLDKSHWNVEIDLTNKILFYFVFMPLGMGVRERVANSNSWENDSKSRAFWGLLSVGGIGLFYISRILLSRNESLLRFQCVQQLFLIVAVVSIFFFFLRCETFLKRNNSFVRRTVDFISSRTLEIYLVQVPILPIVSKLCFPMSLLLAIGGIGLSADIVYRVHHMVIRKVAK